MLRALPGCLLKLEVRGPQEPLCAAVQRGPGKYPLQRCNPVALPVSERRRGASEAGISLPWEGASIAFVWTPASAAAHQMPMWGAAPHPIEQEEQ